MKLTILNLFICIKLNKINIVLEFYLQKRGKFLSGDVYIDKPLWMSPKG